MSYRVFIDKTVEKFFDKHSDDVELIERIEKKILKLSENPYLCAEKSFRSRKCPKCKKTRIGDYRVIYYISDNAGFVELIDIGLRKHIYKKWD
ncbi:MAG: type II toxin-antitoxin system RelE/ParE family toxin [Methanosphaera sp.]|nr:type II toxin-antitoxin system RelE/ParE family toxin [Methanosphaera sp.]